ncbi:MAG TPA: hypothetical protein V6C72_13315 [Chroococcales cyanobacterium]
MADATTTIKSPDFTGAGAAAEDNNPPETSQQPAAASSTDAGPSTSLIVPPADSGLAPAPPVNVITPTRSPTPEPPPPFQLSNHLVRDLESDLKYSTSKLNVEELEHLRAMCLDCIWRRRAEWDRNGMMKELKEIVDEFVKEANEARANDLERMDEDENRAW